MVTKRKRRNQNEKVSRDFSHADDGLRSDGVRRQRTGIIRSGNSKSITAIVGSLYTKDSWCGRSGKSSFRANYTKVEVCSKRISRDSNIRCSTRRSCFYLITPQSYWQDRKGQKEDEECGGGETYYSHCFCFCDIAYVAAPWETKSISF